MNEELLTKLWKQYWKDKDLQVLRFGQFVFNETMYEVTGSYYEENAFVAYDKLRRSLYR
jgi:hypothetical protein